MTDENPDKKPKTRRQVAVSNDLLDALTRAQIELTERQNTLTRDVAAMGMRFDQMARVTNEQIRALVEQVAAMGSAQTRTGEQMQSLASGAPRLQTGPQADEELPDHPTTLEVARWLRKSPSAIYIWAKKGLIPCKKVGGSYIFSKADLIEWARNSPQLGA